MFLYLRVMALICCEDFKWSSCCFLLQKFDLISGALFVVCNILDPEGLGSR